MTVITPPSSFILESKMPGMHMTAEHILTSKGVNQTELTLTFAFNGWLGNLIGKMYGKTTAEYIATEAQSLKKRVETL